MPLKMPILSVKYLILLVILVEYASCEKLPAITFITGTQIKDIGDSVTLNCTVSNKENYSVIWAKMNRGEPSMALSMNHLLSINERKYELNVTNEGRSYILKISNIDASDDGIYVCQIPIKASEIIQSSLEILVKTPAKINDGKTTVTVTATVGKSAQLHCYADGYPRPNITWSREHNAILPIGGLEYMKNILDISPVTKEDRGTYYCLVQNAAGKERKTIDFEVEFPPIISIPRPKVAQALNYDIELECNVMAYPAPAVLWFKNDAEIINSDAYGISHTASVDEITYSVLRVKAIDSYQYGDYYCKASNKLGHAEARINLFAQLVPNVYFAGLQWSSAKMVHPSNLITFLSCTTIMHFSLV